MASPGPEPEPEPALVSSTSTSTATAAAAATGVPAVGEDQAQQQPQLPKLSMQDFHTFNRLAALMDRYHNHFRQTWNMLYQTCDTGTRPAGMSLRTFIHQGLGLCRAITMHHMIEEQEMYPPLAERMPRFKADEHLIGQHALIHEGLDRLEEYLEKCLAGETELRLPEMKDVMDGFGEVLWQHLDDEVRDLGAENMRRYWSKQEMLDMPW